MRIIFYECRVTELACTYKIYVKENGRVFLVIWHTLQKKDNFPRNNIDQSVNIYMSVEKDKKIG